MPVAASNVYINETISKDIKKHIAEQPLHPLRTSLVAPVALASFVFVPIVVIHRQLETKVHLLDSVLLSPWGDLCKRFMFGNACPYMTYSTMPISLTHGSTPGQYGPTHFKSSGVIGLDLMWRCQNPAPFTSMTQ